MASSPSLTLVSRGSAWPGLSRSCPHRRFPQNGAGSWKRRAVCQDLKCLWSYLCATSSANQFYYLLGNTGSGVSSSKRPRGQRHTVTHFRLGDFLDLAGQPIYGQVAISDHPGRSSLLHCMCVLGLVVSGSCWEGYQDGRDPQSEELCNRSARPRYRYVGHRQSQGKVIQVGEESVVRITSHAGQLLLSLNEVTFPRNVDDAEPLQTAAERTNSSTVDLGRAQASTKDQDDRFRPIQTESQ